LSSHRNSAAHESIRGGLGPIEIDDDEEESKSSGALFNKKFESEVIFPSIEEQKRDREVQIKVQYVDAISRVFYHLRGALDEPNFLTERASNRMQIARGGEPGDAN